MEALFSLVFEALVPAILEGLFQFVAELGLTLLFECPRPLFELTCHSLVGAGLGMGSLWFFPQHFITDPVLADVNLVAAPLAGGWLAALAAFLMGRSWLGCMGSFGNGFVAVLVLVLIRWLYAG